MVRLKAGYTLTADGDVCEEAQADNNFAVATYSSAAGSDDRIVQFGVLLDSVQLEGKIAAAARRAEAIRRDRVTIKMGAADAYVLPSRTMGRVPNTLVNKPSGMKNSTLGGGASRTWRHTGSVSVVPGPWWEATDRLPSLVVAFSSTVRGGAERASL